MTSCLVFIFFLFLFFIDTSGKFSWELFPFILLMCVGIYYYILFLSNHIQCSLSANRPLCYVDLHYVYLEFREPIFEKKLKIPIEQVQLLLGKIYDDYYFRLIPCKNMNHEVLLLDFTLVSWQDLLDPSELIITDPFGFSHPRTNFFHAPRIVCCDKPIQYQVWYERFNAYPHPCPED